MKFKKLGKVLLPGIVMIGLQSAVADENNPEVSQFENIDTTVASTDSETDVVDSSVVDSIAHKSDVEDVRSQLLTVDNYINNTVIDRTVARSNRPLTLYASIAFRYSAKNLKDIDKNKRSNTFSVPFGLIGFRGLLFKDYANGKNLSYNVNLLGTPGAAPSFADAAIGYNFISLSDQTNPQISISLGQQKKPFGAEAQSTEENNPAINNSAYLTSPLLFDVAQRDLGIVLKGDVLPKVDYGYSYRAPLFAYSLSIYNGSGPNVLDLNDHKEFVARGVINPPVDYHNFLRGLSVGVSYAKAKQLQTATSTYLKGATSLTKVDSLQGVRERLGVDVSYIRTPVNFTLEGIKGNHELTATANTPKDTAALFAHKKLTYEAASATLFLNFGEQFLRGFKEQSRPDDWWPFTWQPFVRADVLDPNSDQDGIKFAPDGKTVLADGRWQLTETIGANLFFARTTKFQINLLRRDFQKTGIEKFDQNQYEAHLQFTYGF